MFLRPVLAALGAVALLAACGGKQAPAPAASASSGSGNASACVGALPVTGLCPDAGIGVFGKINPTAELQQPGCVWKTMEAQRSADEVLVFRGQDCTSTGMKFSFRFPTPKELHVGVAAAPGVAATEDMAATFLDVPDGKTAEDIAATVLADVPEKERATCAPQPAGTASDETPVAGRAFQLQPDEPTLAAIRKQGAGGIISTCGRYGYTDDFGEVWEGRTKYAIYHSLGQDTIPWDPMSFTFYRRQAGGAWVKQPN